MLLLALCCSRAALAEVSFDANKYYYIIEHTTGRYVSSSATNKEGSYGLLAASLLGEKFRFVSGTTQGKWKITTAAGSPFGAGLSPKHWNTSTRVTEWTIEETRETGVYTFYQTDAPSSGNTTVAGYLNFQNNQTGTKANSLYVDCSTKAGDATHLTKFRIVETSPYQSPQFGGTVWTYNTSTSKFDASGKESTTAPARENDMGPVYKFENVGTVTTRTTANTSDNGGIWVIGSTSNVTCNLGNWAGSVLVETAATATVSYGISLKGTEPASATVWTDGALTFSGRTDFNMNDGGNQRWFIGENGVIRTSFTSVTRGTRTWDLQIVVADQPEVANQARTTTTLSKKVMTWGADLSSDINSVEVWYKDANGTYTKLGANAVSYDASGITVTYTGLGYEPVHYTLTDENGATYEGTYNVPWYGNETALPTLVGAEGYTLSNVSFDDSGETYTMSADITFPFPVSSAGVKNSTGIKSALGSGYYFHVGSGDNADKLWCTKTDAMGTLTLETLKPYRWYIYPQFNTGNFRFTLQSVSTGKFVPTSTSSGTTGPQLVEEASTGTFYYVPSQGGSNGFCTALSGKADGLFLSVNSSNTDNQGVFFYNMSNTSHVGSNLSFPEPPIANNLVNAVFDPLKNATRIPVTEGATIISPKEIAAPAEINAAIEAAQTLAATATGTNNKNLPKIDFTESAQGTILSNYNTWVSAENPLLSVDYTLKAKYGTICLPFNYADPASWKFYRCSGSNGNVLTLVQETYDTRYNGNRWGQNTPYIVEYTGGDVSTADAPKLYQFIGYGRNAGTGVQEDGWLRGVLDESANVPSGSYILSKYNDVLGFYQVGDGVVKACPKYKCYLTVPPTQGSQMKAFFFTGDGEVTGIEGIFGNTEKPVIYNTAGQRLNSLQKGVNIVNGHKVLVK